MRNPAGWLAIWQGCGKESGERPLKVGLWSLVNDREIGDSLRMFALRAFVKDSQP
jgi:hypothetical protein